MAWRRKEPDGVGDGVARRGSIHGWHRGQRSSAAHGTVEPDGMGEEGAHQRGGRRGAWRCWGWRSSARIKALREGRWNFSSGWKEEGGEGEVADRQAPYDGS